MFYVYLRWGSLLPLAVSSVLAFALIIRALCVLLRTREAIDEIESAVGQYSGEPAPSKPIPLADFETLTAEEFIEVVASGSGNAIGDRVAIYIDGRFGGNLPRLLNSRGRQAILGGLIASVLSIWALFTLGLHSAGSALWATGAGAFMAYILVELATQVETRLSRIAHAYTLAAWSVYEMRRRFGGLPGGVASIALALKPPAVETPRNNGAGNINVVMNEFDCPLV